MSIKLGFSCRLGIKAFVVLVPLLGVTWLFGFLSPLHVAFTYTFVILNSTQVQKVYEAVYFYNYSIIAFKVDNCVNEIFMFR